MTNGIREQGSGGKQFLLGNKRPESNRRWGAKVIGQ